MNISENKRKKITAEVGDIVLSLAGRDRGRLYAVIAVLRENCVLLSDGKRRKLTSPKLKSAKHLGFIARADSFPKSEEELAEHLGKYEKDISLPRQRYYKARRGDYSAER